MYKKLIATTLVLGLGAFLFAEETKPAEPKKRVTESGLTIIETGAGAGAKNGDTIWVKYLGKLADGTKFDASADHPETMGGLEVALGQGKVIKGWDEGLLGTNVGDKRTLIVPPNLGYGPQANGPIPANATLTFEIEVVGLKRQ